MTNCPACGLIRGQHGSILQGCTCQFQMMDTRVSFREIREWQSLTDAEIQAIDDATHFHESPDWEARFARAIEQALKEKNHG